MYIRQYKKLVYTFLYWFSCICIHSFLAKFVYNKGISVGLLHSSPLYDIVQEYFPNLQAYRIVPEILHVIPVFILCGYIVYFWHLACLSEFFFKHGSLMLLRSVLFSVTLLPDSSQMCHIANYFGSCFDLLFSGHSTIMFLSTLLLVKHFPIWNFTKNILYSNVAITSCLIVFCRNHYTIDVIISLLLTYFTF
jgi:hypothetical protein